jgi:hypothetical protein
MGASFVRSFGHSFVRAWVRRYKTPRFGSEPETRLLQPFSGPRARSGK